MRPMKLGLAYESCFGDPYRTVFERRGETPAVSLFREGPGKSASTHNRSGATDGWLTSLLLNAAGLSGGEGEEGPRETAPAVRAHHAQPIDQVERTRESATASASSHDCSDHEAAEKTTSVGVPEAQSRAARSESTATHTGEEDVLTGDNEGTHSVDASSRAPSLPSTPTSPLHSQDAGSRAPRDVTGTPTALFQGSTSSSPAACDVGIGTTDLVPDTETEHEEARRAQRNRAVEEELRGGVVARESDEEDRMADIVQRLYDKIRLNAVHVVALDDLNYQLSQLASRGLSVDAKEAGGARANGSSPGAQARADPDKPPTTTTAASPSSSSAFDEKELALYLYGLREQVSQLRQALVSVEAEQASAQRARQKEDAQRAKTARRIRVEVVRAYDSPPRPRVKPPFQPAALPPVRKRREQSVAKGSRAVLDFSIASSLETPSYHDGSAANFEVDSSERDSVPRRSGRGGGRRRQRAVASPLRSSSVSSSRLSSSLTVSTDARSSAPLSVSDDEPFTPSTVTASSAAESERSDSDDDASSSRRAQQESASPTDSGTRSGGAKSNDSDSDSSTGADIFWQRRMEALKRKKARQAAVAARHESSSSSRTSSSARRTASTFTSSASRRSTPTDSEESV